jgi:hypothetical protein
VALLGRFRFFGLFALALKLVISRCYTKNSLKNCAQAYVDYIMDPSFVLRTGLKTVKNINNMTIQIHLMT